MTSSWPTLPTDPSPGWDRFERGLRIFSILAIVGVVVLALTGVTGLKTATDAASSAQIRVEVRHASVSRPGLPTPLSVTVVPVGGQDFPTTLNIHIPTEFLAMFDENGLHPTPDSESSDGTYRTWTYQLAASTDQLTVDYDARLQPNTHTGRDVTVLVDGDADGATPLEVVRVDFHMTVFP